MDDAFSISIDEAIIEDGDEIEVNGKDFTQALTQLTTELMNAGELDKQNVKEILE